MGETNPFSIWNARLYSNDLHNYVLALNPNTEKWKVDALWSLASLMEGNDKEQNHAKKLYDEIVTFLFNNRVYSREVLKIEEMRAVVKKTLASRGEMKRKLQDIEEVKQSLSKIIQEDS